jgi:hypothetical protein
MNKENQKMVEDYIKKISNKKKRLYARMTDEINKFIAVRSNTKISTNDKHAYPILSIHKKMLTGRKGYVNFIVETKNGFYFRADCTVNRMSIYKFKHKSLAWTPNSFGELVFEKTFFPARTKYFPMVLFLLLTYDLFYISGECVLVDGDDL